MATNHDKRTIRYTRNRSRALTSNVTVRIDNKGAPPAGKVIVRYKLVTAIKQHPANNVRFVKCFTDWKGPIMGALPEVVGMRDRGWEESVQDMSRIGYHIFE